ncbi:hypothetical protein GCM10010988_15160 [Cnuibacter physcomitrellae]|uniref:Uncharacterized protein n=1 Tax=Cnuibacter physcomitrellae TaxID=1619308 RepID=A0A1X9LM76_9MICO|nr:hypothetical protein [Cnuibacter physcomitrellae]ARJ06294.1 hypothetical protein B5808_14550 [Cnuibacter physcomitrellae]GGI37676.1 hypothetical protein GCM10010988_15160 [Cnuibacter physcomitrellae]
MTQAGASTDRAVERGAEAAARPRRPAEVTVVVVLTYVVGVLTLLFGILLILLRYDADLQAEGLAFGVTLAGAITILFGFFTLALASLISRADRAARVILTVILGLNILWDVLIIVGSDTVDLVAIIDAVLVAAVIAVLWVGRAARFFRRPA